VYGINVSFSLLLLIKHLMAHLCFIHTHTHTHTERGGKERENRESKRKMETDKAGITIPVGI
jgi:hypothetical protein